MKITTVNGTGGTLISDEDNWFILGSDSTFNLAKGGYNDVFAYGSNDTINQGEATDNFVYDFGKNLTITFSLETRDFTTLTVYGFYAGSGAHVTLQTGDYMGKPFQSASQTPYREGCGAWGTKLVMTGPLMDAATVYFAYIQHVAVVTA
jgi:hypothetical protein